MQDRPSSVVQGIDGNPFTKNDFSALLAKNPRKAMNQNPRAYFHTLKLAP
jgi:hypothetical protein